MDKVIIIKESFEQIGGVDKQILRISKELKIRNILEPILVTSCIDFPLSKAFLELGLRVFIIPLGEGLIVNKGLNELYKLVEDENVKFIQTHLFREIIIGRLIKRKRPSIIHIFRAQTYIDCLNISKLKKSFYHFLDYFSSKYVDIYIGNGDKVCNEIVSKSWISKKKVISIYNGCESLGPEDLFDYSGINNFKIAMIANLWPGKGHDTLIKSLAILKSKGVKINCRLIGDEIFSQKNVNNSFKIQLQNLASEFQVLDLIEFYGYSSDIYAAIKDIPVIVLPSDSEGVPNCILESMSVRKIVVASEVGGIPFIIQDKENGFLHPPKDSEKLANILFHIFNQPFLNFDKIRESAYLTWQQKYSIERMMGELSDVYKRYK